MPRKISSLAVGAKVCDPLSKYYGVPVYFLVADKNHTGYPANSTTLITEKIIALKCFDATESGGDSSRQSYGNNRWSLANLRQWLNKSGTNWFVAQHSYRSAKEAQIMDTNMTFRMDSEVKAQMAAICTELGMTTSTAFNIFANAFVCAKGMPFAVTIQESAAMVP